ncbi:hypothetical protein [Leptospira weilii]|nr:hypothetical protein [Leptospira weilii]
MKEAKVVRAGKFEITVCNRKKNQESDEISLPQIPTSSGNAVL